MTTTPRRQLAAQVAEARRTLDVVYCPAELECLPTDRLLAEADAFRDAYGTARTGLVIA